MNNHGDLVFLIVEDEESNIIVLRMLLQKNTMQKCFAHVTGSRG